jgi:hypothetical protein
VRRMKHDNRRFAVAPIDRFGMHSIGIGDA